MLAHLHLASWRPLRTSAELSLLLLSLHCCCCCCTHHPCTHLHLDLMAAVVRTSSPFLSPRPVCLAFAPSAHCMACSTALLPLPLLPLTTLTCVLRSRERSWNSRTAEWQGSSQKCGGRRAAAAPTTSTRCSSFIAPAMHVTIHAILAPQMAGVRPISCLLLAQTATPPAAQGLLCV